MTSLSEIHLKGEEQSPGTRLGGHLLSCVKRPVAEPLDTQGCFQQTLGSSAKGFFLTMENAGPIEASLN